MCCRCAAPFKAARFSGDADTTMLQRLAADIEAARFTDAAGTVMEIPVKLKVHESLFVPMAKWAMLIAGNYRCVGADDMRPIQQAVHDDIDLSRAIYNQVVDLCIGWAVMLLIWFRLINMPRLRNRLAARHRRPEALAAGAKNIERVDKLVQTIARQKDQTIDGLDEIVRLVDQWLTKNRA